MMKRLITTVLFAVALQGCVTGAEFTGTGPVTLSDRQQVFFDDWARGTTDRDSLYFFLVRGGSAYAVVCPETRAICRDSNEYASYQTCESKYGEGRCKLYGVYGNVVWQFDKPADVSWWNVNRRPVVDENTQALKINWTGRSAALTAFIKFHKAVERYSLSVTILDETLCEGAGEMSGESNFWHLTCVDGVSAKGNFWSPGEGRGMIGEGVDTKGNKINFWVAAKSS